MSTVDVDALVVCACVSCESEDEDGPSQQGSIHARAFALLGIARPGFRGPRKESRTGGPRPNPPFCRRLFRSWRHPCWFVGGPFAKRCSVPRCCSVVEEVCSGTSCIGPSPSSVVCAGMAGKGA